HSHRHPPSFPTRRSSDLPLGAERIRQRIRDRAEQEAVVIIHELAAAADPQQVVIGELRAADLVRELQTLRPFDLDRRNREKQRTDRKSTRLNSSHLVISY